MIALAAALAVLSALHVELRQELSLDRPGATAAYAVDADVADATAADGRVTIRGRGRGTTSVSVVTDDGVETFTVIVDPPPPPFRADASERAREGGNAAVAYDSGTSRIFTEIGLLSRGAERTLRFHLLGTGMLGERRGDALAALPNVSLGIEQGGRELVLLDDFVARSPLTVDGASLRGAHYRGDSLELHAGVSSPLLYEGFILPADPETVLGASYRIGLTGESSLTPAVYGFPSARAGGTSGAIATLLYEYSIRSLRLRAETGFGHRPGAALELSWESAAQSIWLDARYRPQGISSLGIGQPHGAFATGVWTARVLPRLTLTAAGSLGRQELPAFEQRSATGSFEARSLVAQGLTVSAGASVAGAGVGGQRIRSFTLPLRVAIEGDAASASALVRYQRNSASNSGGPGGRLDGRLRLGAFSMGAWADVQKDAATLDLVFREVPELARAFAELGLSARTPEELASILQNNPALAQLGYVEGATVNLHPWRVQSGTELSWSGERQRFTLRLQVDATQTVARSDRTALATAAFTRSLSRSIEAFASWTSWTRNEGSGWSIGAGLRATFDELPRLTLRPRRISGAVVGEDGTGVPGARVRLDGSREIVTDGTGAFSFDGVGDERHRLQALAPDGAYFAGRSTVEVGAGDTPRFEIRQGSARLSGTVRDDAGGPLAGVLLRLAGAQAGETASTDSSGHYAFSPAPGEFTLSLDAGSLPPGYDAADAAPRTVRLVQSEPAHLEWIVPAGRSIAGTVVITPRHAVPVWLVGTDRKIVARPDGAFVFRNLRPGTWTVAADLDGAEVHEVVRVPEGPAVVHVELRRPVPASPAKR